MDLLPKWAARAALLLVAAAGPVVSAPEAPDPNAAPASQPAGPVLPLSVDQVAAHLGESADWFHHVTSLQPPPSVDSLSRNRVHQQVLTAVQLALEFGRACAKLLSVGAL